MYDTSRTIEQILILLANAPSRLADLTEGLSPEQLTASPEPEDASNPADSAHPTDSAHSQNAMHPPEWSARDVLAHLRACSDMWGKYILQILSEDKPVIKAVNPTTWIKQTNYVEQEFQPSLQAFTAQRAGLLAVLQPLAPEAWSRAATVTGAGKPRERTVYSYALWLANHEQTHIKQIKRICDAANRRFSYANPTRTHPR